MIVTGEMVAAGTGTNVRIGRWNKTPAGDVVLVGSRCTACEEVVFPERRACPNCAAETLEEIELGGPGTLQSFTVVHRVPDGFNGPVAVGYAELPGGVLVLAPIDIAPPDLAVGTSVELHEAPTRFDEEGRSLSTYRFRQARDAEVGR